MADPEEDRSTPRQPPQQPGVLPSPINVRTGSNAESLQDNPLPPPRVLGTQRDLTGSETTLAGQTAATPVRDGEKLDRIEREGLNLTERLKVTLTPDQRAFAALRPIETMLDDPLQEVARKERRSLLGISLVAILVSVADLIPMKVENFGITFNPPRRQALLWMFVAAVVYYVFAFVSYATSDYLLHRRKVYVARIELKKREAERASAPLSQRIELTEPPWRPLPFVSGASRYRIFVDCILPLIVAAIGIGLLVCSALRGPRMTGPWAGLNHCTTEVLQRLHPRSTEEA